VRYFLVVYDPQAEEVTFEEYLDEAAASAAHVAAERRHREDDVQVVLFAADSLEAVMATHPHYFVRKGRGTAPFPAVG
jgi:hypothetical protein